MSYVTNHFDEKIVQLLKSGAVGVMPTDTIYGLSCSALNRSAVERVHRLKGKEPSRPLIVLISSLEMLKILSISKDQAQAVKKYWPGSISLEFRATGSPYWLHFGNKHFAIRMPSYPELRSLIDKVGPIVSTSANLAGEKPAVSIKEAKKIFGDQLDFYVDVGKIEALPSTLVKEENGKLVVIRQGGLKIYDA